MNTHSILVVDDEPDTLLAVGNVLRRAGHRVKTALDGAEAMALLAKDDFDLVVTDVIMPGMDGIELIKQIRLRCPGARILAMSGGGHLLPTDYCTKLSDCLGADASVAKPFDIGALFSAMDSALGPHCPASQ